MMLIKTLSKLLIALLLTVITNQAVFATIQPPDFSEFRSDLKMGYLINYKFLGIRYFTDYKRTQKKYDEWHKKYWEEREEAFNTSLKQCEVLTTDYEQDHCYMTLRLSEQNKTTDYIKKYYTDLIESRRTCPSCSICS